jgi:hypothetical protein
LRIPAAGIFKKLDAASLIFWIFPISAFTSKHNILPQNLVNWKNIFLANAEIAVESSKAVTTGWVILPTLKLTKDGAI